MEHSNLIQIGEFAKRAGTNLRTLRYYEELDLLRPAARSGGGFRYYCEAQLDRIGAIKRLQDLGLHLKEIASAMTLDGPTRGPDVLARLRPALERQIALTKERMDKLRSDLDELSEAHRKLVEMCQCCQHSFSREHCDPCPLDGKNMPSVLRALL